MSYAASEKSGYGGKPVELYRFTRGITVWTYTSADNPITYNGEVYAPATIKRGAMPHNDEVTNATLDLFLDPTLDIVTKFISGSTPTPTGVTVMRRHRDELVSTEQAVLFIGAVGVVEFSEAETHFTCVPIQKSAQRKVPRWVYQTTCNHMLYDQYCGINPTAYTFLGHITVITGRTVTVPEAAGKADGYYNGGYLKDGDTYAFIQTHVGPQLLLLAISPALVVGDSVATTAGCDRRQSTCIAKFNNLPNFMGWPYIPVQNPYATSLTAAN